MLVLSDDEIDKLLVGAENSPGPKKDIIDSIDDIVSSVVSNQSSPFIIKNDAEYVNSIDTIHKLQRENTSLKKENRSLKSVIQSLQERLNNISISGIFKD